jgi:hypothetical protein
MTDAIASHAHHSNYHPDKQAKTCYGLLQQSDHSAIKSFKTGSMSTDPSDAVGYGEPPLPTRFKPGQRAIPGGRPRGARNWKTLLAEALDRRVLVTEGGQRRRIAKCELGIIRLADRRAARSGRSGAWLAGELSC